MNWFLIALIAPALWSATNHIDKYIIGRFLKAPGISVGVYILFTCSIPLLFLPFIFLLNRDIFSLPPQYILLIMFNGSLYVLGLLPYIFALNKDEASIVVPLFQTIPIFSYVLGYIVLKETLTPMQIFASLLIILGAIGISLELNERRIKFKKEVFLLMFLASFLVALNGLIFKFVAVQENFWATSFWEYTGFLVLGVLILTFVKSYRNQYFQIIKLNTLPVLGTVSFNEILNIVAKISLNFATTLAPLALVWVVNGFQPFFVFIYGVILTLFFPHITKENLSRNSIIQKLVAIAIMFIGTIFINK